MKGRIIRRARRACRQAGQAAFEFVLALFFLIALTAMLFQALHFERDVFNQSMIARFEFFKEAHTNQDDTPCRSFDIAFQGKELGDIGFEVPGQTIDESIHYGVKRYRGERGSKYIDTFSMAHEFFVWTAVMLPDHYEETAGNVDDLAQGAFNLLIAELPFRTC
jgi:hypothetical protein